MGLIYMLGMAGSGKTTMTAMFGNWLSRRGEVVAKVNLDPGVMELPYVPDFDVKEIVNLFDLMRREGLGPNGGLLRANEIILENIDVIVDRINSLLSKASYVLVDTPGQLELFAFRELGSRLVSKLSDQNSVGIFIIDAKNLEKPSDVVMAVLLALAVRFHLDIEVVMILNKMDVASRKTLDLVRQFYSNPGLFLEEIKRQDGGVLGEMSAELVKVLRDSLLSARVMGVSVLRMENLEDVFSIIHDVFCGCGDLM